MKKVGFQLDHYFYTEAAIKANIEYESSSTEERSAPNVQVFMSRGDDKFHMGLKYQLEASTSSDPYNLKFMLAASFTGDSELSEDEQAKQIAFSGPNMLYGILRDTINTLSLKCVWDEFIIPPVIFEPDDFASPQ